MKTSEQLNELISALLKVDIKNVKKDATAKGKNFSYDYATLDNVIYVSKDELTKNGLVFIQGTNVDNVLVSRIFHTSGQWIETETKLIGATDMQQLGSAITYARRYAQLSMLNLSTTEDDDAQSISKNKIEEENLDKTIFVKFERNDPDFANKLSKIKSLGFRWNPDQKQWSKQVGDKQAKKLELDLKDFELVVEDL